MHLSECDQLSIDYCGHPRAVAERKKRATYDYSCACVADKVQLAVDLADVVALRSCGPEKRYHDVVLILELEGGRR